MAMARAVFPVPGGPARRRARPAIFFKLIISTTIPAAYAVKAGRWTHFSRALLSDESRFHGNGFSVFVESESFDMRMSCDALSFPAGIGLFCHLVGNGGEGGNTFIWERGRDDYGGNGLGVFIIESA